MKRCILFTLVLALASHVALAERTITDDFSDGDYTSNPVWTYDLGPEPTAAGGFLYIPTNSGEYGGTIVTLSFPEDANNTLPYSMSCEVEFDIFLGSSVWEGGNYEVLIELRNTQVNQPFGLAYQIYCSTKADAYYSSSGFRQYAESGPESSYVAGKEGAHLSPTAGIKSHMKYTFSPDTGCKVYQNGVEVASFSNFQDIIEMNTFSVRPMTSGPFWRIDNVIVTYDIPTCVGTVLQGDINDDCYINVLDLAEFADTWLECSNPLDPCCNQ